MYPINDKLIISISNSIAVSAGGNQYQGIGVKPDIPSTKEMALEVAHKAALKNIKNR